MIKVEEKKFPIKIDDIIFDQKVNDKNNEKYLTKKISMLKS